MPVPASASLHGNKHAWGGVKTLVTREQYPGIKSINQGRVTARAGGVSDGRHEFERLLAVCGSPGPDPHAAYQNA